MISTALNNDVKHSQEKVYAHYLFFCCGPSSNWALLRLYQNSFFLIWFNAQLFWVILTST